MGQKIMSTGILLLILLGSASVVAADDTSRREKKLDFEDGYVEGMGKKGGDIGSLTSKEKRSRKIHLYGRHREIESDLGQTVQDMGSE